MATLILFLLLHAVSMVTVLLALWRLYHYIRRYRFDESKYTLLFGFVHLHWIAELYIVMIGLWIGVSYLFIF